MKGLNFSVFTCHPSEKDSFPISQVQLSLLWRKVTGALKIVVFSNFSHKFNFSLNSVQKGLPYLTISFPSVMKKWVCTLKGYFHTLFPLSQVRILSLFPSLGFMNISFQPVYVTAGYWTYTLQTKDLSLSGNQYGNMTIAHP
jgi:hypothetical protein